jgi:hypothetical protein
MIKGKIYTPTVVKDALSSLNSMLGFDSPSSAKSSTSTIYTSPVTVTNIPKKVVASELLNESLNTKDRKILGNFDFGRSGAIQIGDFDTGISGDVRISPAGVTARNKNGETTFNLDADTGDSTFKGTVMAADFVIADENGLVSLNSFNNSVTTNSSIATTSSSYQTLTGSAITKTLTRDTLCVIFITCDTYLVESIGNTGTGVLNVFINDTLHTPGIDIGSGNNQKRNSSLQLVRTLSEGENVIDLRAKLSTIYAGSPEFKCDAVQLSILFLGN